VYGHPSATVRLQASSYELLQREATRRGIDPDALADELVRAKLGVANGNLEAALGGLAELRAGLPDIDGVALAREARCDLEQRGA
jgi:hypothetical protein